MVSTFKSTYLFLLALLISVNAQAQENRSVAARTKPAPPEMTVIKMPSGTAGDAIVKVYFSEKDPKSSPDLKGFLELEAESVKLHIRIFDDMAEGKLESLKEKVNPKDIFNHLEFYGIGLEAAKAIVRLNEATGGVDLTTDINPAVEVDFKEGEEYVTDHRRYKIIDNPENDRALGLKYLLDHGFEFGKNLHSPGKYREKDGKIIPIEHSKRVITEVKKKLVQMIDGSGNLVNTARINFAQLFVEPKILEYFYEYKLAAAKGYDKGVGTEDIPRPNPLMLEYPDGSFSEHHFCSPKWNPIDRLVDHYFQMWIKDPEIMAQLVREYTFLITNGHLIDGLDNLRMSETEMRIFGAISNQFMTMGWGLGMVQEGFNAYTTYRTKYGWARSKRLFADGTDRVDLYVHAAPHPDKKKTSLEGAPDADLLLHAKFMSFLLKFMKLPDLMSFLVFGSQNFSNHGDSREGMHFFFVKAMSLLARAHNESIDHVIKANPKTYIPVEIQEIRIMMERLLSRSVYEISEEAILKFIDAIRKEDLAEVAKQLHVIDNGPSDLIARLKPDERSVNIEHFVAILDWLDKNSYYPHPLKKMSLQHIYDVLIAAGANTNPKQLVSIFEGLTYRQNQPIPEKTKNVLALAKIVDKQAEVKEALIALKKFQEDKAKKDAVIEEKAAAKAEKKAADEKKEAKENPPANKTTAKPKSVSQLVPEAFDEKALAERFINLISDIDLTILRLNTRVRLFLKSDPTQYKDIGSKEYNAEKENIIKGEGPFGKYFIDRDKSFVDFKSKDQGAWTTFEEQSKDGIATRPDVMAGGSEIFNHYAELSKTNPNVILTGESARGHDIPDMNKGLQVFVDAKKLVRLFHEYALGSSLRDNPDNLTIPEFKEKDIRTRLDRAEAFADKYNPVYEPLVIFMDDEEPNIRKFLDETSRMMAENPDRWNNIEIRAIKVNEFEGTITEFWVQHDGHIQNLGTSAIPPHLQSEAFKARLTKAIPLARKINSQTMKDWIEKLDLPNISCDEVMGNIDTSETVH